MFDMLMNTDRASLNSENARRITGNEKKGGCLGCVAQWLEHPAYIRAVLGSSPSTPKVSFLLVRTTDGILYI